MTPEDNFATSYGLEDKSEFEDRSDYLTVENIFHWNVKNDFFRSIQAQLLGTGSRLLEGPRGTGKTHQMKIVYHECVRAGTAKPFAIFVTLNKYFYLEPLLIKEVSAIGVFHSWVLCKIILGVHAFVSEAHPEYELTLDEFIPTEASISLDKIRKFESIVESPYLFNEKNYDLSLNINISNTIIFIERVARDLNRSRTILLLDDAALTLTPEYFIEFLDIFRSLKTKTISPKASVYPGTTQYSPRFHVGHDAQIVYCWMSIENERYFEFMSSLLDARFSEYLNDIAPEIIDIIKFASFGVPRTLIGLLRSYHESKSIEKTTQTRFNTMMEKRAYLMEVEYLSLKKKMLQFDDIISTGWVFFKNVIKEFKEANKTLSTEKLIELGLQFDDQKMTNRMIGFLKEAGLLYEFTTVVKHGEDREYRRFFPHILFLIENRTFSKGRGFNSQEILRYLNSKSRKHPLRRSVNKILKPEDLDRLRLSLPPCQNCQTKRLTEDQKFCHNCGRQLINKSSFEECMNLTIADLPLSDWQKSKLTGIQIHTIGDFLTLTNPGGELRKAKGIGKVKSELISATIHTQVNEILEKALTDFLS